MWNYKKTDFIHPVGPLRVSVWIQEGCKEHELDWFTTSTVIGCALWRVTSLTSACNDVAEAYTHARFDDRIRRVRTGKSFYVSHEFFISFLELMFCNRLYMRYRIVGEGGIPSSCVTCSLRLYPANIISPLSSGYYFNSKDTIFKISNAVFHVNVMQIVFMVHYTRMPTMKTISILFIRLLKIVESGYHKTFTF